jgi:parallel beta-helix repeat protein
LKGEKMSKIGRKLVFMLISLCLLTATFGVRPVLADGPVYIRADGTVDPPEAPIHRNGDLYTLTDNITSTTDGIIIEKDNITIDGNGHTVQGGVVGNAFYLYGASNVTIRNTRTRGFNYGIYLESTSGNIIHGNDIAESTYDGISLYDAVDNIMSFNRIEDNGWSSIGLYYSSGNSVTGNYIAGNYFGINLLGSELNSIFHNTLIGNTNQASSDDLPNSWDNGYPSGGDYWSGYTGIDVYSGPDQNQPGSDGIGDTPYNCTGNNQDRYPLMQPWINLAVVNVLPSKTAVGEGYKVNISVTVQNQGWNAQTTKLTVYVNTTVVGTIASLALPRRSQAILNFTWQTTLAFRGNYVVSSTVDPVPNEPDIRDNNKTYGRIVKVTVVGDVNGDGAVDIFDAITLSNAFASVPNSPTWNGNADINSDNSVDIFDAILLSGNFGKKI